MGKLDELNQKFTKMMARQYEKEERLTAVFKSHNPMKWLTGLLIDSFVSDDDYP